MKKYFILALALVLALGIFASCNKGDDGEETTLPGVTTDGITTTADIETIGGESDMSSTDITTYTETSADGTDTTQTTDAETSDDVTTDDGKKLCTVEFFVDGVSYGTAQFEEGYLLKKEDFPTVPKTPGTRVSWPGNVVIGTDDIQVFAIVEDDNTTPMQTF